MRNNPLGVNMNNEGLAVSFIWKDQSAQSLGYIPINIVLNPLERHNHSAEILVSVSVSNPIAQFVTDATHFAWIGLLLIGN